MQPAPRASSSVRDAALSGHHALLRGVLHADSVMAWRLRIQSVVFSSPIGHLLPCSSSISQYRRNLRARAEALRRQSHSAAALFQFPSRLFERSGQYGAREISGGHLGTRHRRRSAASPRRTLLPTPPAVHPCDGSLGAGCQTGCLTGSETASQRINCPASTCRDKTWCTWETSSRPESGAVARCRQPMTGGGARHLI